MKNSNVKVSTKKEQKQFTTVVGGSNFMTPDVLAFYTTLNFIVELSEGDFMGSSMYGVTMIDKITNTHIYNLSKSFKTLGSSNNYIDNIDALKKVYSDFGTRESEIFNRLFKVVLQQDNDYKTYRYYDYDMNYFDVTTYPDNSIKITG